MKAEVDYPGITIVYFCHDGNKNFLMGKRTNNSRDEWEKWDIGAGALDLGFTIDQTLRKEIMEEYCTNVLRYQYLGYRELHRNDELGRKTHWLGLDFKVLVDRNKVKIGEPHKIEKIEWFNLDNFPKNTHSQWLIFLNKYRDKLSK